MAATSRTSEESDHTVYGIIGNIPPSYHAVDLRNYFSQFLEPGGFKCFHFRHRPETQKRRELRESPSKSPTTDQNNEASTSSDRTKKEVPKSKKTMCCVVTLTSEKMEELIKMYHKKHWLDKKGESIPALCFISRIKVAKADSPTLKYLTRKEQKQVPSDREIFTEDHLKSMIELQPPGIMPHGNVGTPTRHFLELIKACQLPPSIIRKLRLDFPKNRSKRKYGDIPYDYEGDVVAVPTEEQSVVTAHGTILEREDQTIGKHVQKPKLGGDLKTELEEPKEVEDSSSGEEEEWDRHEALHDDTANVERNKERLFEEELELKWEKGGSGLVFYTDAQFWDEQEGDFDEKTADDWDVDMEIYADPDAGDKDARDYVAMRQEKRRRDGKEDTDMFTAGIGKFEKHTKGIGRKVLQKQGWEEGKGLGGSKMGIVEALDNDGQNPRDRRGLGYHGEKLVRYGPSAVKKKRRNPDDEPIISSIYDDPAETDPPEPLYTRNHSHHIKYRDGLQFNKATDSDS